VTTTSDDSARLRQKKWRADLLMIVCGVFAFAWVAPALALIWRDGDLRPVSGVLWQLWPLGPIPLCGFGAAWWWRISLQRRLSGLKMQETGNNG
jgi:hypothetical protein